MMHNTGPSRETSRVSWWDYSVNGIYFITVVCHNRTTFFGSVIDEKVILTEAGQLAEILWKEIPTQFANVILDEFIVMPDHIHGILIVKPHEADDQKDLPYPSGGITGLSNPMLHNGLPRIIRWYKGRFSFDVKKHLHSFKWQPRYYDKIIHSPQELNAYRNYIQTNPKRWNRR